MHGAMNNFPEMSRLKEGWVEKGEGCLAKHIIRLAGPEEPFSWRGLVD